MAHVEKYLKNQLGNMLAHYERSRNGANEHIDAERTCNNYNLAPDRGPLLDWVHKRLEGVKVQQRDDVKFMCDWIVTVPKDLAVNKHKAFFAGVYDFCCQKYGEQNIISAYVHMDEATPHIHVAWVPVVIDKKKGIEKLSSKESLGGPKELRKFHADLQHELEQRLRCPVNILNEATAEGNKSIDELRRGEAKKRLEEASEVARDIEDHAGKLLQGLQQAVAVAPVSADSFDQYWHDNWAGKWQHKQKLFGKDESRIEMDKADFIELFGDLEKYYTLAKDLAEKNKALQEALPQIVDEADLLKAGELRVAEACFNRQIRELGEQYNRAIKNEKVLSDKASDIAYRLSLSSLEYNKLDKKYKDLDKDYKRLQEEHEELQKECDRAENITTTFYEMFRRYPDTMQEVLQNYCDATKQDIEFADENGVIGKAKCRVRELGQEIE